MNKDTVEKEKEGSMGKSKMPTDRRTNKLMWKSGNIIQKIRTEIANAP